MNHALRFLMPGDDVHVESNETYYGYCHDKPGNHSMFLAPFPYLVSIYHTKHGKVQDYHKHKVNLT